LVGGVAFCVALALYVTTATRTITTQFGGVDGGELVATALSGGVAHPPGYPTYLLLARGALFIPWGEPAARLALLSALAGAFAVAATALLVARSAWAAAPRSPWQAPCLGGLYAGLTLALCERMWSQSIIVEVYTLHLLWLALCALLFQLWITTGRRLAAAAYVFGLGLGTHLTLGMLFPAAILAWACGPKRRRLMWRSAGLVFGALAAGLAVYGFLPLWAAHEALPSWGDPRSLLGFWRHISAAEYRYLVGVVPWAQRLARLSYVARDLLRQPGPIGVCLAFGWGLPHGWRVERSLLVLSAVVALSSLIFAIGYGGADSTVYLLPWTWVWCVWAGFGAAAVARQIGDRVRQRWVAPVFGLLLALGLGWTLVTQYPRLDLHHAAAERERVLAQLAVLAPDALVFTSTDADTFGMWYAQRALMVRPDVVVIDTRLARWPWYRAQLRRQLATDALCQAIQTSARPRYQLDAAGALVAVAGAAPIDAALCAAN
jgi:hypothetical protein